MKYRRDPTPSCSSLSRVSPWNQLTGKGDGSSATVTRDSTWYVMHHCPCRNRLSSERRNIATVQRSAKPEGVRSALFTEAEGRVSLVNGRQPLFSYSPIHAVSRWQSTTDSTVSGECLNKLVGLPYRQFSLFYTLPPPFFFWGGRWGWW